VELIQRAVCGGHRVSTGRVGVDHRLGVRPLQALLARCGGIRCTTC
jgi:hypothetical protein